MPKTKRDLLYAMADIVGGDQAVQLRALLQKKTAVDDILDRPMSDEEFAARMQQLPRDIAKARARMQGEQWMKSGEWGDN